MTDDDPETCTRCDREPVEGLHKGYCIVCYDYIREYGEP